MKAIRWPVFLVAAPVVAIDQLTKYWALTTLSMGESVPVMGWALQWILAKNSGAAFSFLSNATWVFTIVSFTVAVGIAIYVLSGKIKSSKWAFVAGLILAGAVGNLIDRFFREPAFGVGHVIDFIYTPWIVPAVYNVADISIVVGMGLFIIFSFFESKKENLLKETAEEENV